MDEDFWAKFATPETRNCEFFRSTEQKNLYKSITYSRLLTVYDMCKAADRGMVMGEIRVLTKSGGKSGDWAAA